MGARLMEGAEERQQAFPALKLVARLPGIGAPPIGVTKRQTQGADIGGQGYLLGENIWDQRAIVPGFAVEILADRAFYATPVFSFSFFFPGGLRGLRPHPRRLPFVRAIGGKRELRPFLRLFVMVQFACNSQFNPVGTNSE